MSGSSDSESSRNSDYLVPNNKIISAVPRRMNMEFFGQSTSQVPTKPDLVPITSLRENLLESLPSSSNQQQDNMSKFKRDDRKIMKIFFQRTNCRCE